MFSFVKRIPWFPTASVLFISLILVASAGCQAAPPSVAPPSLPASAPASTASALPSSTPPPAPTVSAQDIIKNVTAAQAKLTSYQYAINMVLNSSSVVSGKTQNTKVTISGTGANDISAQQMQMNAGMDIESPNQGKMSLPVVFYLVNGWQYIKISIPMAGDQWSKSRMDMNSYDARDDAQHASELLQSSLNSTVTGTEVVDAVSCYVLQIIPDPATLAQWLKSAQQTSNVQGSQSPNLDLSKFVKNLTVQEWIAKDTYLLKKSSILATLSMNGPDLGSSAQTVDSLNMDISQTLTLSQYNQPVSVVLPAESQNAKDVTVPTTGIPPAAKPSATSSMSLPSSATAAPPPMSTLPPPPLTTPVPPAGMTTYVNAVHRWTIAYPGKTWPPNGSNPAHVTFSPVDNSSGFYVDWLGQGHSTTLNDFVDAILASQQQSDIKNGLTRKIDSRETISLPNNVSAVDVTWELPDYKGRYVFIFMGDHEFIIDAETYIAQWNSLNPTFDKMIKSFTAQ